LRELLELTVIELGEQRYLLQIVGYDAHGAILRLRSHGEKGTITATEHDKGYLL
jgi:hypothetical protein